MGLLGELILIVDCPLVLIMSTCLARVDRILSIEHGAIASNNDLFILLFTTITTCSR